MSEAKKHNDPGRNVRNIAVAGMVTALTIVLLYLTVLLQWNTIFLLALAAYLTGTLCYLTTVPHAAAGMTATAILSFLLLPKKTYVFIYLLLSVYVLVFETICKQRTKGTPIPAAKEWSVKAAVWHALAFVGGILAILFFQLLTGLDDNGGLFGPDPLSCITYVFDAPAKFLGFLHDLPDVVKLLILLAVADIFWVIFDRAYLYYARLVNLKIKKIQSDT